MLQLFFIHTILNYLLNKFLELSFFPTCKSLKDKEASKDICFSYINMAEDGYNLAFVFNTSVATDNAVCPSGLECMLENTIGYFANCFENVVQVNVMSSSIQCIQHLC